jgi:acyl-ACP thioesterase
MDARGRLRLDAVARYLQDVATDDVAETGWGAPEFLWVVRRTEVHVVAPVVGAQRVELATWCSGVGASAAGRRTSIIGGAGRIETDSVWINVAADGRPVRIEPTFLSVYGEACGGRRVSTRFSLPQPGADARRSRWVVRAADIDLMGHVNNPVYWAAVEEALAACGPGAAERTRLDDDLVARVVWGLRDIAVRDRALELALIAEPSALEELWTECARRAPEPLDAAPATLLAVTAWLRGDGAMANVALERALDSDPAYSLARLLAEALARCLSPSDLRAMIAGASGPRSLG